MSESPDVFDPRVKRGAGVRRMNRRPLIAIFGVAVLVMAVVMYTVNERTYDAGAERTAAAKKADPASAVGLFDNQPQAGLIEATTPPVIEAPQDVGPAEPTDAMPNDRQATGGHSRPLDSNAYMAEWQQYRQQQNQLAQAQMQAAMSALTAGSGAGEFGRNAGSASAPGGLPGVPGMADAAGQLDRLAQLAQHVTQQSQGGGEPDLNNAAGKREWLDSPADPAAYLPAGRRPQISPYEIKTGTVIPGVMIGGINSDLPGQIIAQVRENVWDTATGKYLLIPQGARLIGTYDNQVTRGQSRVLVAWNRIIYPDGSSLDLGAMPGSDQGGYAGFKDKVNSKYWKVFGDAMMLSLFSAGIQLSQPQSTVGQGYDSQQIVSAAIGQQLGQTGMQMTQRNLQIQPTLQIRPGYRFNVQVTRDMILSPWRAPS